MHGEYGDSPLARSGGATSELSSTFCFAQLLLIPCAA
jgi:hypothetical protein